LAGYEFFYVDDPETASKDLDIAYKHRHDVPVGFIVAALKRKPQILDYVETFIFQSDKCFAVFPPN